MRLTLRAAQTAVEAAHQRASQRNAPSAVAVVDEGGNLLVFAASEVAMLAACDLAIGKAYTAITLRTDTAGLGESVLPGGQFYGLNNALSGRALITFAGGRPLRDRGTGAVFGAIRVSGGTIEDDTDISLAAVTALRNLLSQDEDVRGPRS